MLHFPGSLKFSADPENSGDCDGCDDENDDADDDGALRRHRFAVGVAVVVVGRLLIGV